MLADEDMCTFTSAGTPRLRFEWLSALPHLLGFLKLEACDYSRMPCASVADFRRCLTGLTLRRGTDRTGAALVTIDGVLLVS